MNPYPCTIIADRYNGCYSGGLWTAWPLYADQVPPEQDDGDTECSDFWYSYKHPVGKGSTPQEALDALIALLTHAPERGK